MACTHCYALIPKVNLLKHLATCKNLEKNTTMRELNVVQKPQVMMKIPAALISEELREVLSSLKDDSVAYCIMHDNLILHYGQFLIDKQVDTEIYRYKSYLKKKLRQTADFLIALRKHSERPRAPLEAFFCSKAF